MKDHILQGAVLICGDTDIATVVSLLSLPRITIINYTYFERPTDYDHTTPFDFVVVSRLPCLAEFVKRMAELNVPIPLIVHLAHPRLIPEINYAELFPSVKVLPVPQASLDLMDITLKYDQFLAIIEMLSSNLD